MFQVQTVFERYEKKYLLDEARFSALWKRVGGRMREDAYGRYGIRNLYYDTPDYRLIRSSLDGPAYKEKLRLRCYGAPGAGGPVFLELKKKYRGVVYKRRVRLGQEEAERYLAAGERPEGGGQILSEIDYFLGFYRPEPKVFIGYDRTALSGLEQPELRMTFDRDIRWREAPLDLSSGGRPLLEAGRVLMELKLPGAMPLWLSRLLGELELYPVSFSKYGVCYREHLAKNLTPMGGMHCA